MPIRASLHFHKINPDPEIESVYSVNAHSGFSSFPLSSCERSDRDCYCVNAHSGFSSFPQISFVNCTDAMVCVNAHSGFSSFPRKRSWKKSCNHVMCQCPFGLLFISTRKINSRKYSDCFVSMPIRASLHFHGMGKLEDFNTDIRVNAHSGFSSFPQHPSEIRRNKAFSRPFLQIFI